MDEEEEEEEGDGDDGWEEDINTVADGDGESDRDEDRVWCLSGEIDGVPAGKLDGDLDVEKSVLSDPVVVFPVISRGLVVAVVVVVVEAVDCPFLWPLSLDLSLDLSLGLDVPTGRLDTCISPFASAPVISPLPSSSPFPFSSPLSFSSPLLLSSPRFFFPLPLPPLPLALEVTVSSLLPPGWVVVSDSTRTQSTMLDEVISGAELEALDVWVSGFSRVLVLSVVIGIPEAGKVDARRVGEPTLAGALLSLEGLLNHELPQENKPAKGTK